jgi:hypothetical protein
MAGTLAEQATLAQDSAFVNKVKAAMIFRASANFNSATAQTFRTLEQCRTILGNGGDDAQRIAWLAAVVIPAIASAAPAVPSDATTQTAVDTILAALIK